MHGQDEAAGAGKVEGAEVERDVFAVIAGGWSLGAQGLTGDGNLERAGGEGGGFGCQLELSGGAKLEFRKN